MKQPNESPLNTNKVADIALKLALLAVLILACFRILLPFLSVIVWGGIIAISVGPLHARLQAMFGDKKKLSVLIITLLFLSLLFIPSYFLTGSMIDGVKHFGSDFKLENLQIEAPPENVQQIPLIGNSVAAIWQSASENLFETLQEFKPQLQKAGSWLLNSLLSTSWGFVQLLISIIIAAIFLSNASTASTYCLNLFEKILGERGAEFYEASAITIRNVAKGILGVAIIQSILLGFAFILAGIPYAGLWALLCLALSIIQVGPGVVSIPIIVYMFITKDSLPAISWTVVILALTLLDNYLKPKIMGKGAPVPMLIIFLGALGGFMAFGFLGLFTGAIVLSLGYKLMISWLKDEKSSMPEDIKPA